MQFKSVIEIDVSKLTLDIAVISQDAVLESFKIQNKPLVIEKLFQKLFQSVDFEKFLLMVLANISHMYH
jgi:hypothetical protein